MLSFLFWNMGGDAPKTSEPAKRRARDRLLHRALINLVNVHRLDVIILAECPLETGKILSDLNRKTPATFREPDPLSQCTRITILSRFPRRYFSAIGTVESDTYTCRRIKLPAKRELPELLLIAVHLRSKLYQSDDSQALSMPGFCRDVVYRLEHKWKHQRTILVGDFNLNPFDAGMVGAEGLNAVMTRDIALRESRVVDKQTYPFFYNPMWGHFGDLRHETCPPHHPNHAPPGTCYYAAKESRWYYWQMLDQVLLRPALLDFFHNEDLRIVVTDGETRFINERGIPTRDLVSDHLPVMFRLRV